MEATVLGLYRVCAQVGALKCNSHAYSIKLHLLKGRSLSVCGQLSHQQNVTLLAEKKMEATI